MDWNILGHVWAAGMLQQHIIRSRLCHAYLLCGPVGVGRRTLGLRFAQALNCTQPPEPGQFCGQCRSCQQTWRMEQTDLSIIRRRNDKKDILIDQVREVQHSLSLMPYEAAYRVALLLDFDNATANAQNAILKTLEEAPPRVILVLTADSVESLLPTIVSRCEVLRLRPTALEDLAGALHVRWGLEGPNAGILAHLAGGRVGIALRLHQDPSLLEAHNGWVQDVITLIHASKKVRFGYVEKNIKRREREDIRRIVETWLSFLRDVFLKAIGSGAALINLAWEKQIHELAEKLGPAEAYRMVADLEQGLVRLDTTNANTQLLVEVLLLDWPKIS
jgi:DNA polymerase-3 subunit delta'